MEMIYCIAGNSPCSAHPSRDVRCSLGERVAQRRFGAAGGINRRANPEKILDKIG